MCKTGNLTVSTGWVVRSSDQKALSCAQGSVPWLPLGCVHCRRGWEVGPTEAPVQRRARCATAAVGGLGPGLRRTVYLCLSPEAHFFLQRGGQGTLCPIDPRAW